MIKREYYGENKAGKLYRTYSDEGYKIKQIETDTIYDEAIDVETANYTYEETDILIESAEATEEDYQNSLKRLGVE